MALCRRSFVKFTPLTRISSRGGAASSNKVAMLTSQQRPTRSMRHPCLWLPFPESDVAGRALQVGVDRRSSWAFKGAGTETDCCQESSVEQLFDRWNSGPWMGFGQCISNTELLDLWQLCETDEKQYNMGHLNGLKLFCKPWGNYYYKSKRVPLDVDERMISMHLLCQVD